jgi:uncharacterized protein
MKNVTMIARAPATRQSRGRRGEARVRVALLADTHGHVDARVVEIASTCDVVVHAGDVGAARVLDLLASAVPRLIAVRGNNDRAGKWPRQEAARLRQLADAETLSLPGGDLVVLHGDGHPAGGRHRRLRAAHGGARAVVYGHSHRLVIDTSEDPWVLNPGAAGRIRTYGGPSCLVLEVVGGAWNVTPHRFPRV